MNLGILPLEERIVLDAAGAVDVTGVDPLAAAAELPVPGADRTDAPREEDETARRAREGTAVLSAATIDGSGLAPLAGDGFGNPWHGAPERSDAEVDEAAVPAATAACAQADADASPFRDDRLAAVQDGINALLDDDGRLNLMAAQLLRDEQA